MRNLVLASLIALVGTEAAAQSTNHYATVSVARSDTAAGTVSGVSRLRIGKAIDTVCGSPTDAVNAEQFAEMGRCRRAAWADVTRQLDRTHAEVRIATRAR